MVRSHLVIDRIAATAIASVLAMAPLTSHAQSRPRGGPSDSATIVFVCEHGTVKSVVAMAWFQRLARERGLAVRAVSRGTALEPTVPAGVAAGLERDGFRLAGFTPTPFTPLDLRSAIAVVSFDQPGVTEIVGRRAPTLAWDQLPAVTTDYATARDSIRARVTVLVDSLMVRYGPKGRGRRPSPSRQGH